MNQTFKKKVIAASLTMAFAAASGVVIGNEFAASSMNTPTTVVLVQGGLPKMTNTLTLTEVGTFANATTNPLGFRVTIPAGIDLYGSYLTTSVGTTATTVATASKFTPTSGNVYPLRYTAATIDSTSFIYIDTALGGTSLSTAVQTDTSSMSTSRNLAIFAVHGSTGSGNVDMALNGGYLRANTSASALSNFFTAGTASATAINGGGSVAAATATTDVMLRKSDGGTTAVWSMANSNNIGSIKAETDGSLTVTLFAGSQNTSQSTDTVVIPPLALAASSSATTGNASLTITDGINASPASSELLNLTNGTKAIATVTGNSLSVSKNVSTSTIPDGIITLSNQAADPVKIAFASPVSAAAANTITLTLSGGAKFVPEAAFAAGYGLTSTTLKTGTNTGDTSGHFSQGATSSGVLSSDRTVLTLTLDNEAIASDDSFIIGSTSTASYLDLTSATAGDINMTVTSSIASAGSQTIKIASAVARSAAVSYGDVAPTGYTTLFTGRTGQTTTDTVVLTEAATGSLLVNGAIVLTLDKGAKFTAADSITVTTSDVVSGTGSNLGIGNITAAGTSGSSSSASASASGSVSTASTTAKGKATIASFDFDLTSASTGDLTVTVSGGAGAAGSAKIATIANATSASVSGAMPTLVPGGSAQTLADIVITEAAYGALTSSSNGTLSVKLPTGVTYDTTTVPTVTVTNASGTALSGKITTPAAAHFTKNYAGTDASTYNLQITAPSNSSEGPMTIKISGLKATAASTASSGELNVLIHGNTNGLAQPASADEGTSGSNVGAMPTKQSLKVGTVGSSNVSQSVTTAAGTVSSQTVTANFVPAGNDQGKQGSVFVAALLPSTLGGGVYFMSSAGAWTQFSSCTTAPAYYTGNLSSLSDIKVATGMDVSGLVGTQVYLGHGLGGALSPAGTACTNMLNNGSYIMTYTIK